MGLSTVDIFKKMNVEGDDFIVMDEDLIRRYQQVLVKIAEDIVDICETWNITYHLTGGSALGAVRHHGFIPWDDDMDIDILSSDFDLFHEKFMEKYGDKYWFHTCDTKDHGMTVNRIRLKGTTFRAREDVGKDECGFFIDILRIENAYDNLILRSLHGILCMGAGFLLSCRNFYHNRKLMLELVESNPDVKKAFTTKINIGRLICFIPLTTCAKITQKVYGMCKNNNSRLVTVPAGRKHYYGEMQKRCDFVDTTKMEFEGHMWDIPKNYKRYLKNMYGNYMEIPKEEDREKHILLEIHFPEEN